MGTHSEPAHGKAPNSFVLNEPMITSQIVAWILANIGALVVGQTHLVSSTQWSGLAQGLTPVITAVVVAASAVIFRRYVSPAWKLADTQAQRLGVPLPPPPDDTEGAFEDIDKILQDIDKIGWQQKPNARLPEGDAMEIDASWQPPRAHLVTASQVRQATVDAPQRPLNALSTVGPPRSEVGPVELIFPPARRSNFPPRRLNWSHT